jgi:hypothetical protein
MSGFYKKGEMKNGERFRKGGWERKKLTYGGLLSNGESGNKRKDSEGFHDDHGEGKEGGAAVKERLSLFVL